MPVESARLLPNPPSATPNLSHRICQSPWSAFSSFHTKDQQQQGQEQQQVIEEQQELGQDQQQREEEQQEEIAEPVTSSTSQVCNRISCVWELFHFFIMEGNELCQNFEVDQLLLASTVFCFVGFRPSVCFLSNCMYSTILRMLCLMVNQVET